MRIKLDENLGSPRVAERLRSAGHDIATVQEQRLQGSTDEQLVEVCRNEGRCLVTFDLGFADSVRYVPSTCAGIVVLRMPARLTLESIDAAIETLIAALVGRDARGKLWIVQGRRIREHQTD